MTARDPFPLLRTAFLALTLAAPCRGGGSKAHPTGSAAPSASAGPDLDALPKGEWLVCYCGCPQAESGARARQLLEAGFAKVTVLEEGYGAWAAANHPIHTGAVP